VTHNGLEISPIAVDADGIRKICGVLDSADFKEDSVLRLLGTQSFPGVSERRQPSPELLERTDDSGTLGTLVRLFVLGKSVSLKSFSDAVEPTETVDWQTVGLIDVKDGAVHGNVELGLYADVIAAADWPGKSGERVDEVMGLAPSSRALIQMTVRRKVDTAFDLGTGCGVQAILASRHSGQVMAADINPRAVRFAKFNATLNNAENISYSTGSLFEPVTDKQFDLIVCNPPFVIGPKLTLRHTSSGIRSDQFCESIIRSAPEFLADGGFAQIVCNWAHIGDETSEQHLGPWFENNGCEVWTLCSHTESASDYARLRADENSADRQSADALYDEWLRYFDGENISRVSFGVISLRRSSQAENWRRYDDFPGANGPCGRAIELGFLSREFLNAHRDDARLLEVCVRHTPELKFLGDDRDSKKVRLRLDSGLTFAAVVDTEIADFVGRCNGRLTLGEQARKIAAENNLPLSRVVPQFLAAVRKLIEPGFLVPNEVLGKLED